MEKRRKKGKIDLNITKLGNPEEGSERKGPGSQSWEQGEKGSVRTQRVKRRSRTKSCYEGGAKVGDSTKETVQAWPEWSRMEEEFLRRQKVAPCLILGQGQGGKNQKRLSDPATRTQCRCWLGAVWVEMCRKEVGGGRLRSGGMKEKVARGQSFRTCGFKREEAGTSLVVQWLRI